MPGKAQRLLKSCLEKDPKRRLRDIADAWRLLEDAPSEPFRATRTAWVIAVVTTAVAIAALSALWRRGEGTLPEVMHLDISYPSNVEPISGQQGGGFAISPDGHSIAMIGVREGVRRVYLRRFDRPEPVEINATEGVSFVDFSPDSTSLAFVAISGSLTRLSVTDQQPAVIALGADVTSPFSWGHGEIVIRAGVRYGLWRRKVARRAS